MPASASSADAFWLLMPHTWASVLWSAGMNKFGGSDRLIHLQARQVTIDADQPMPTQIDGDPAGVTPITATVIERGVRIMLPRL